MFQYLLAMVFAYFKRARLGLREFNRMKLLLSICPYFLGALTFMGFNITLPLYLREIFILGQSCSYRPILIENVYNSTITD